MTTHIRENSIAVQATADLSGFKFRAVTLGGTVAAGPERAAGILKTGATSGYNCSVVMEGVTKGQVGGAVSTVGWPLTVTTSGYLAAATSGQLAIGRAVATASSGDIAEVAVDFGGLNYVVI